MKAVFAFLYPWAKRTCGSVRLAPKSRLKDFLSILKSRRRGICLYAAFAGTFVTVLYLYHVRMDAVWYACLLSSVWFFLAGALECARFAKTHRGLLETGEMLKAGQCSMPPPRSLIEKDYQDLVTKLHEESVLAMSDAQIARQEMVDYYSMWVHQIKTPIAAMRLLLQSYENGMCGSGGEVCAGTDMYRDSQAAACRHTKEMELELFKIEQYVEMVLTYLRMERMSSDLSFGRYALDTAVKQAVRKYSRMFILKKIRFLYTPVEEEVLTDEKWLVFVLEQLLSNALKYTAAHGSISIYMDDTEKKKEKGKKEKGGEPPVFPCLVVEDTGIGIFSEDLPRVFEKGFTGYNGRTDKKSTGIGLYLCKMIMDKLGHRIWMESEAGKGTKVYLSFEKTVRHE